MNSEHLQISVGFHYIGLSRNHKAQSRLTGAKASVHFGSRAAFRKQEGIREHNPWSGHIGSATEPGRVESTCGASHRTCHLAIGVEAESSVEAASRSFK